MPEAPELITFDIFGTVLDWRAGLESACRAAGRPIGGGEFDRIVDVQGELEQGEFICYTEITARSLRQVLALNDEAAARIAVGIGDWPLYSDSQASLRALMQISPCAAMTNSDRAHGEQIQRRLGMQLSDWLCAEEARVYKPNPRFWELVAKRRGIEPSRRWWHVSAYADYDLAVANSCQLSGQVIRQLSAR